MKKSIKSKAEEQFTLSQKKAKQFIAEKDKSAQARADKTARLRELRLAKESAEK